MTVVPRDVIARRHFTAGAIGLALYVYSKQGAAGSAFSARVGLWGHGPGAWRTVRRWLCAVEDGRVFRGIRSSPSGWPPRRRAERAAMTLVACAVSPETVSEEARVFAGAVVST